MNEELAELTKTSTKISPSQANIQEAQYEFPYHYIPRVCDDGAPSLLRTLPWGMEYLCYQLHLRNTVHQLHPTSVLEVGCGDGHFLGHLGPSVPRRVGIDLSLRATRFAQAFWPDCIFIAGDVACVKEQFDVVAAIEVLEHVPDGAVHSFLRSLETRIAPNGRLVLCVPTKNVPVHEKHYRHYFLEDVVRQLRDSGVNLEVLDYGYLYREPIWLPWVRRIMNNRLWVLEVRFLMKLMWGVIWSRHRMASEKTGRHLLVVLGSGQKNSDSF